jgi:hypothetical protein
MIYLKQHFDIEPASPAGLDRFVELAEQALVPGWARAGGRIVGAWFSSEEWFNQVTQVIAFPDLAALDAARREASGDAQLSEAEGVLETLAPIRRESLLEPLGPVAPEKLDAAIEAAEETPAGVHSMAILEVAPGKMAAFSKLLAAAAGGLPIIASWRDVAGNPSQVIDLWTGDVAGRPYRPNSPGMDAFFGPLRELAPKERTVRLFPLPYSPLR